MKALNCYIEIGEQIRMDFATSVEIEKSFRTFTDTCTITIPRNIKVTQQGQGIKGGIKQYVKQGSRVRVALGYDNDLQTEFEGFVSRINPDIPMVIYCEDYMDHLKRTNINHSFKNTTLPAVIAYLVGEYHKDPARPRINYQVTSTTSLGSFVVENATTVKVLEKLKEYGFYSFFRGDTLYCGYPSEFATGKRQTYYFDRNIISNDLEYKLREDQQVKVKAISHFLDGSKKEVEVGEDGGDHRTLNFFNVAAADLKSVAQEELKKFTDPGYRGSFTSFGQPTVEPGDTVELKDPEYPERDNESYQADSVKITWGTNPAGYRRTITPGYKLKN